MNISHWQLRFNAGFFHQLEDVGAAKVLLLPPTEAIEIGKLLEDHSFTERPERYGPRGVLQNFSACEEEDIPETSPVRKISRVLSETMQKVVSTGRSDFFTPTLEFNDHLLLKYSRGEVGLGIHQDHSKYKNLIVSINLAGVARFNIHDESLGEPTRIFNCIPGMAVFMRAPGFLGQDVRPYHSVTNITEERTVLVLKQKG